MAPDPAEQVAQARRRARELVGRGYSGHDTARRLAAEFFVCVYCAAGKVYASFFKGDREHIYALVTERGAA